ncbi:LysR family transcriptional regulator [Aequorivita capsosiphonis]|uniref:LysR family transcriptional regulator n=1 Tax=Aequorivita capsosiphonis TaxID=487317 RepID=UPI000401604D|nr:LysR substrate-binding domain-containing protein [Aequorivita capsosiphonis]
MNFHQLKYIVSVDSNRNFSRAAEECEVAQSTLSREIQRLEQEFDIIIFDRTRHPVAPTMKGIDLIEQAKKILQEEERFISLAEKRENRPSGSFKLGILTSLAPYLIPLFIDKITQKYPELNLEIFEMGTAEMLENFERDTLDGAISIAPFQKEGFYETSLFEEEFVLYVGRNHVLSESSSVQWADIPQSELTLPQGMKSYFLEQKPDLLQPDVTAKTISYQNASLETIRKIIDRNGGLTLIPQLACLYMGNRRLEMVRSIKDPVLSRTINFIAPRGFQKTRLSKVILSEIIKSIPKNIQLKMIADLEND